MKLLSTGLTMEKVSHLVGTSVASVCRWHQALTKGGAAALTSKPVPGRPRKLQQRECQRLLAVLLKGAVAYGYPNGDGSSDAKMNERNLSWERQTRRLLA